LVSWSSHWVLAYSFHRSYVFFHWNFFWFSLLSILPLSFEILSFTWSSLLEWPSTVFCFVLFTKVTF
jgi:hypothetical protein